MTAPQDLYMEVNGIKIRYWAKGDRGTPVVLIHGIGGYMENWEPSVDPLAAQHRVYAFDWPGQGRSDKPRDIPCTIADLAHFTRDFMAALKIERAHVAGHSLGGAIATRLALLHPEAVDRLVLVAPAGLGRGIAPALGLWRWPLIGELLTRPSRPFSDSFNKLAVLDPGLITDDIVEYDYQMTLLPGWQRSFLKLDRTNVNWLFGQAKSMVEPNVRGLPTIDKPTLVVWGRQDRIVPVGHAKVAARGIPHARVEIFEDCGHSPMFEYPSAFNELLLNFLKD